MPDPALFAAPHRRYNPLTGEWVLVSSQRTARPWQGSAEPAAGAQRPAYDPDCYLCPGNARAGGVRNPAYSGIYVFDNDFAALLPGTPSARLDEGLLRAESARGICRVVCFSPRHDLDLATLDPAAVRAVVNAWAAQYDELGTRPWVRHVQIFENHGAQMGASNPHPHGQIWADERLPDEPVKELHHQQAYLGARGRCLLCAYLEQEWRDGARLVEQNAQFVALAPFWAVWPFETLVLPRRHRAALPELDPAERDALADLLGRLTRRYNRLFGVSFPYSLGWHQRPTDGQPHPEWHLHAHCYPPLLRSATIRKFMVGYELLGQPQRDLTPETAAERLRALPGE